MNCVVISDVHGNLDALLAVKKRIRKLAPDEVVFLGDVVGYGAAPNECIEELRSMANMIIAGNHDFGAVDMTDTRLFNPIAREALGSADRWSEILERNPGVDPRQLQPGEPLQLPK